MPNSLQSSANVSLIKQKSRPRGIFQILPEAMKVKLLADKKIQKFKDSQFLQQHGDDAIGFWVVKKGLVRLGRYLEHGQLQVLLIVANNDSFGELSCFTKEPRLVDAIATGDVEAYWISCNEFMTAIEEFPDSYPKILTILASQLQQTLDITLLNRLQSASEKLKWSLSFFCSDMEAPIHLPLSQTDLSDMIGVSRMTISKSLKEMEEEGILVREYGYLKILKPDLLLD